MSPGDGGRSRATLIWHRDFRLLWFANTVSLAGSAITLVALPMVAVYTLNASPFAVGLLMTMTWLPPLVLGLPAGAWIDRVRRRPTMVAADLGRATILAVVPLAGLAGVLHMWQLYGVAAALGTLTMLFELGWAAYLPSLIPQAHLVEGKSMLEGSRTVVGIGGPGLGGLLVQVMTAPFALILDAVSFVVSALSLAAIRADEPAAMPSDRTAVRTSVGEGVRFLVDRPVAGIFVVFVALASFVMTAHQALLVLFLARTVGLSPSAVGLLLAVGGIGGLAGAIATPGLSRMLGSARTIWLAVVLAFPFGLFIPLTRPGPGLVAYVVGAGVLACGITISNIIASSFLLTICPRQLLGRVTSAARVLQGAGQVLGGVVGGALGGWFGIRTGIWVTMIALVAVAAFVFGSPLRQLRDLPT